MFVDRFSEVMRAVKWHFKSLLLTDDFFFFLPDLVLPNTCREIFTFFTVLTFVLMVQIQ